VNYGKPTTVEFPSDVMLDRDLSLELSHYRLVLKTRPCVQHSMRRHLPVPCRELQCRGFGITRIIRHVAFGAHSCRIRCYDQAMFATEDIGFTTRMRKSDVCEAGEESYVSKNGGTILSVIQTTGKMGRSTATSAWNQSGGSYCTAGALCAPPLNCAGSIE
jgi:hypothetical protein